MTRANDYPEPCDHNVKAAYDRTLDPPADELDECEGCPPWVDCNCAAEWLADLAREDRS